VPTPTPSITSGERADLLSALTTQRSFLRVTVRGLTTEEATRRTTVSELCLGGLIKHVAEVESGWIDFVLAGPKAMSSAGEPSAGAAADARSAGFHLQRGESLAGLLEHYAEVARRTDGVVADADLDASHPLPEAPWFEPGARWSARRVLLHIIAETAQHAGHADIIRESLDGSKTMG
jgi:hypothetical protein